MKDNLIVLKFSDEGVEVWLRGVLFTRKPSIDDANSIATSLKYRNLKIAC